MATSGINEILVRSRRKLVNEEEESRKKMKTCLLTISAMIKIITSWYHNRFMVRVPLQHWDKKRRYLNRLCNGNEVDCIEQLRVSKQAFIKL